MALGKEVEGGANKPTGEKLSPSERQARRLISQLERQILSTSTAWKLVADKSTRAYQKFVKETDKLVKSMTTFSTARELGMASNIRLPGNAQRTYASLMSRRRMAEETLEKRYQATYGARLLEKEQSFLSRRDRLASIQVAKQKERDLQEQETKEKEIDAARKKEQAEELKFWQYGIKEQDKLKARDQGVFLNFQKQQKSQVEYAKKNEQAFLRLKDATIPSLAQIRSSLLGPSSVAGAGGGGGGRRGYVMGFGRGRYGRHIGSILEGMGLAKLPISGGVAAGLGVASLLGYLAYDLWSGTNTAGSNLRGTQEAIARASRISGFGPNGIRGLLGGGRRIGSVAASPYLYNTLGYASQQEALGVFNAYRSPFRSPVAFLMASRLSQSRLGGAMPPEAYQRLFEEMTGQFQMGTGPHGLENLTQAVDKGFRLAAKYTLPPPAVMENVETLLRGIAATNAGISGTEAIRMAAQAGQYGLPSLRNMSAQVSALQYNQQRFGNMFSNPVDLTMWFNTMTRLTGTATPGAGGVEHALRKAGFLHGRLTKEQAEAINAYRAAPQMYLPVLAATMPGVWQKLPTMFEKYGFGKGVPSIARKVISLDIIKSLMARTYAGAEFGFAPGAAGAGGLKGTGMKGVTGIFMSPDGVLYGKDTTGHVIPLTKTGGKPYAGPAIAGLDEHTLKERSTVATHFNEKLEGANTKLEVLGHTTAFVNNALTNFKDSLNAIIGDIQNYFNSTTPAAPLGAMHIEPTAGSHSALSGHVVPHVRSGKLPP